MKNFKKQCKQNELQNETVITREEALLLKYEQKERIEKTLKQIEESIIDEMEKLKKYNGLLLHDYDRGNICGICHDARYVKEHSTKIEELSKDHFTLTEMLKRL